MVEFKLPPYQGWSNRHTWAVNLLLQNDYKWYQQIADRLKHKMSIGILAIWLERNKDRILEETLELQYLFLFTKLPTQVNWLEIATFWHTQKGI